MIRDLEKAGAIRGVVVVLEFFVLGAVDVQFSKEALTVGADNAVRQGHF